MARGALACKFVHCGKPAKSSFPQWSRWKLPRSPSPAPSSTAPSSPGPSSTAPPLLPRRRPLGAPRDPRRPPTRRPRRSPPFSAAPLATSISTSDRLPTTGSAVFLNCPLVTAPPRASRLRRSVATAGSAAAASPPRRASLLPHSPPPAEHRCYSPRHQSAALLHARSQAAAHHSPEASSPSRRPVPKPARPPRRLHDHEPLHAAVGASSSLLPVFVFDPRDFGKSPSGFDRTGPYRANFLLDSVADLRRSLRARGGDLVVRVGRPEVVIPELARATGAEAVYAHGEVSRDECSAEEKLSKAIEKEGVEVKYFWGSTLYHLDDLPFRLEDMPSNYGGFKEAVKGLEVRKVLDAPEEVKCVPMKNVLEPGEIPTLGELGLSAPPAMAQDSKSAVGSTLIGGEAEALERLKKFAVG